MDYQKIYQKIILNAKLQKREKFKGTYYENHHILPDFMFLERKRKGRKGHLLGDPNDKSNLVLLTTREHIICHILLTKIYKYTRYRLQTRAALAIFFTEVICKHPRHNQEKLSNSRKYEKYRLESIKAISDSKKGKMVVKDVNTGIIIGTIDLTHPNVLNGTWVHHTKGTKKSEAAKKNQKSVSGDLNPNFKRLDENRLTRLYSLVPKSLYKNDIFVCRKFLDDNLKEEFKEFKKISYQWVINNFGTIENLINEYNLKYNADYKYDPYYTQRKRRKYSVKN